MMYLYKFVLYILLNTCISDYNIMMFLSFILVS